MGKIPAACQKILDEMKAVHAKMKAIQSAPGSIQGKNDPHPGKPDPEDLKEVRRLIAKIDGLTAAFNDCLVRNVTPAPLRLTVDSIKCTMQQEGGIYEDDEPYVIVVGIDLT